MKLNKNYLIPIFYSIISFGGGGFFGGSSGGGGTGLLNLNGLTADPQLFSTGTSGTNFNISSSSDTHTFNIPDAGSSARGVVTTGTQTFAGSKTFSSTITGSISGNAGTATALASNPTDCSAGQYASAIAASGNLTCADPFSGMVESYTGHIETASDKTYVIDHYASYAKQITNIRIKCTSGSITAALKINGTNITTCNGISVTTTSATTTCDTGSTNDLAANSELTLVTSANSSCTDLIFTVKTTRD